MKNGLGLVMLLIVAACGDPPVPAIDVGAVDGGHTTTTRICGEIDTGCMCDPASAPVACRTEARFEAGRMICGDGTRFCTGGVWSECTMIESVRAYTGVKLLTPPTRCNPCDPACFGAEAIPEEADLVPTNSDQVRFDPVRGGVVLDTQTNGTGFGADTDGDGTPDVLDDCVGPGTRAPCTTPEIGFTHVLPFEGATVIDPIVVDFPIQPSDIYVLMDGTGSMSQEMNQLRNALQTVTVPGSCPAATNLGLLGAIRCVVPDAHFGLGTFQEFAGSGPGTNDSGNEFNVPYHHIQDITEDLSLVRRAVSALYPIDNNDNAESATQALFSAVTGLGIGRSYGSRTDCAAGRYGFPCFRPDAVPVVLLFTDAMFHEGPIAGYDYRASPSNSDRDVVWPATLMPPVRGVVPFTSESVGTSVHLGDFTEAYASYLVSTRGMANNEGTSCGGVGGAAGPGGSDAVVRFSLSQAIELSIDTSGSAVNTTLEVRNAAGTMTICNADDPIVGLTYGSRIRATLPAGDYSLVIDGNALPLAPGLIEWGATDYWYHIYGEPSPATPSATPRVEAGVVRLNVRSRRNVLLDDGGVGENAASPRSLGNLVPGMPLETLGTTMFAVDDFGLSCAIGAGQPDRAFRFHVDQPMRVHLSTRGSSFDTALALVSAGGVVHGCNDDSAFVRHDNAVSDLVVDLPAAGDYDVLLDGSTRERRFDGTTGALVVTENPSAGDYRLTIEGFSGSEVGVAPVGDATVAPRELGVLAPGFHSVAGNTALALGDHEATGCGATVAAATRAAKDAVFAFELAAPGYVTLSTAGSYVSHVTGARLDTALVLLDAAGVELACHDDVDAANATSLISTGLLPVGRYFVVVDGVGGKSALDVTAGEFLLGIRVSDTSDVAVSSPRVAETVATAYDLGDLTTRRRAIGGNTFGMASNAGTSRPDVFFRFRLTSTTDVVIDTRGSTAADHATRTFDTFLALLRDTSALVDGSTTTSIATNNDDPTLGVGSRISRITATLGAGTYYVMLEGASSSSTESGRGRFRLDIGAVDGASTDLFFGDDRAGVAYDVGTIDGTVRTLAFVPDASVPNQWLGCEASTLKSNYGELRYAFRLNADSVVSVDTPEAPPSGDTIVAIERADGVQVMCRNEGARSVAFTQSLPSGSYVLVVKASGPGGPIRLGAEPVLVSTLDPIDARFTVPAPVSYADVESALVERGVFVITVSSCGTPPTYADRAPGYNCDHVREAARALGYATGTLDVFDEPIVQEIPPSLASTSGEFEAVSVAVVQGVERFAAAQRFDLEVRCRDTTPTNGIDECTFVEWMGAPSPAGCPTDRCEGMTLTGCARCLPSTGLPFEVQFRNDAFPSAGTWQRFDFAIELVADGSRVVESLPVTIGVPPTAPSTFTEGRFELGYDTSSVCAIPGQRPRWSPLELSAEVPVGTSMRLDVFAGDTAPSGVGAPTFSVPITGPTSVDLGGAFLANLGHANPIYVLIRAVLVPDVTLTTSPVLREWQLEFTCFDSE